MKFLAAILLFDFSSLIAQPMVTLVNYGLTKEKTVCTIACCQKHEQPEKKQAQKLPFGCCSNNMTNPFAQCCCCIGFLPEQQATGITILPNENRVVFTNTGVLLPNYSSDCWRPPELAV